MLAAVASVVSWELKTVASGVARGLDESPLESPLFALGLVAIVLAFASLGVAVARGRPVAFKVLGGVVGVLIGFGHSVLASLAAEAVVPDSAGWVEAEAGLWFSAMLALGVSAYLHTSRGTARTIG